MTSHPHHICGKDKLDTEAIDDDQSIFHNVVPMPVIMIAQKECIMYTRVLRPTSAKVLRILDDLVKRNKPQYWLTIYLTTFILLHSCSMITRRDRETARQYRLNVSFPDPFPDLAYSSTRYRQSMRIQRASPSIRSA
jgi:hypothetical protein